MIADSTLAQAARVNGQKEETPDVSEAAQLLLRMAEAVDRYDTLSELLEEG